MDLNEYQQAVVAVLTAAGHKIELRKEHEGSFRAERHIDDTDLGTDLRGRNGRVHGISSAADGYRTVWRARALTGDPAKDAKMLLARFEVATETLAVDRAAKKASAARMDRCAVLNNALAVPGALVSTANGRTTFKLNMPDEFATPEMVAKLGAAIRAVLSETT